MVLLRLKWHDVIIASAGVAQHGLQQLPRVILFLVAAAKERFESLTKRGVDDAVKDKVESEVTGLHDVGHVRNYMADVTPRFVRVNVAKDFSR